MGDEEVSKRSFKGRSGQDKKNNQSQDLLKQQVNDLAIQMTYLSHQVIIIYSLFDCFFFFFNSLNKLFMNEKKIRGKFND